MYTKNTGHMTKMAAMQVLCCTILTHFSDLEELKSRPWSLELD